MKLKIVDVGIVRELLEPTGKCRRYYEIQAEPIEGGCICEDTRDPLPKGINPLIAIKLKGMIIEVEE